MGRGGGHRRGVPLSAATKKKISEALRGKHHPHKGHPLSPETREKISKAEKARAATHTAVRGGGARRSSARRGGTAVSTRAGRKVLSTARPTAKRGPVLAAALRTRKFHAGAHRLIMVGTRRHRTGLIHAPRKHRHRIVIHRHVKHHRVWRKRKG